MIAGKDDGHQCECGHAHEHELVRPAAANSDSPAVCLLLTSIGNTRIAIATWSEDRRSPARHFDLSELDKALGEMQRIWESFPPGGKRTIVVESVNPPCLAEFRQACERLHIGPLLIIGEDLAPPMPADVLEPGKVGTDRLCAAAAAYAGVKSACAVADFGTAVTIDLVADNGVFLGGTILPGMALCARALHEHTAQLPLVEVGRPTETLGKNTTDAIRNGIFAMMTGALREITERYATDIGKWPPLVVTGGDAEAIAGACDFVDRVVPDLGLDGMVIAWQQAFGPRET